MKSAHNSFGSTAGFAAKVDVLANEFLGILEKKMQRRNEQLMRKLIAWAELLDAAGWCVALKQPEDRMIWLGNLARQHLQSMGRVPVEWNELAIVLGGIPHSAIHRSGDGLFVWSRPAGAPPVSQVEANLTRREVEVMTWLREGKTGQEMAIILGCATRTVDKHLANIYRKLGVRDRGAAIFKSNHALLK